MTETRVNSQNPFSPNYVPPTAMEIEQRRQEMAADHWRMPTEKHSHLYHSYVGSFTYSASDCLCSQGEDYIEGRPCDEDWDEGELLDHHEFAISESYPRFGFDVDKDGGLREAVEAVHRIGYDSFLMRVPMCEEHGAVDIRVYGPLASPGEKVDVLNIAAIVQAAPEPTHVWVKALSSNAAARVTAARLRRKMPDRVKVVVNGSNVLAVTK